MTHTLSQTSLLYDCGGIPGSPVLKPRSARDWCGSVTIMLTLASLKWEVQALLFILGHR
jgi:hypothetical protein